LRIGDRLSEIGYQADERRIPLIHNLGKRSRAACHKYLAHTIVKAQDGVLVDAQETLCGALLGDFIVQLHVPYAVTMY
jgi:hypothetical protein